MQDQDFEHSSGQVGRETGSIKDRVTSAAGDAYAKAAELTGEAAERARLAAADATRTAGSQVKQLLDHQVGIGAAMIGDVAHSVGVAAGELDRSAPQLAGLARGLADRMSGYAEDLDNKSADELLRAASDLTRRQPALVFGLAAVAGFFLFRSFKNAPDVTSSPSLQPSQQGFGESPGAGLRRSTTNGV
jgi:hypothetical protein